MGVYTAIRGWVDRQWLASGSRYKTILLPGILPLFPALLLGKTLTLGVLCMAWFVVWHGFVFWRGWLCLKQASAKADEDYCRVGKYRLAKDYHDSESATAARKRRGRG